MNHHRARVKQEYPGASSSASDMASPRPMDCLHDAGPPPFLTKTYDIVDDPTSDHIISWSKDNNSFVVWDSQAFSMSLLPRYFKHNNFSSFIRQLNTYGFRKVDPDRWEFANEGFLRGQKHLLKNIRRRKSLQPQASSSQHSLDSCVEVGIFGLDREIDRLKRDKQVLMLELVKLRQQQQTSRGYLQEMEQRIHKTELKQQQMMKLLAKAMKNPEFIQQLVQQNDKRKELEEVINKKRRRPIDQGQCSIVHDPDLGTSFVTVEPEYYGDIAEFEGINELDTLRIDEDNFFREELLVEEEGDRTESRVNRVLDEDFWECLMNESNEEGIGLLDTRNETEEDVDVLVEQLGFLDSSPKL